MSTAVEPKIGPPQMAEPTKGDRLFCRKCEMEIEIVADCKTTAGHHTRFECCGQPLTPRSDRFIEPGYQDPANR